jgi:hypothetical protein
MYTELAAKVKGIYKWEPLRIRTAGRPKNRWEDDVIKDLKLLKIKNWTKCIQNREEWRRIVEDKLSKNEVVVP